MFWGVEKETRDMFMLLKFQIYWNFIKVSSFYNVMAMECHLYWLKTVRVQSFSDPNAWKNGPEKLQIGPLFRQCLHLVLAKRKSYESQQHKKIMFDFAKRIILFMKCYWLVLKFGFKHSFLPSRHLFVQSEQCEH